MSTFDDKSSNVKYKYVVSPEENKVKVAEFIKITELIF